MFNVTYDKNISDKHVLLRRTSCYIQAIAKRKKGNGLVEIPHWLYQISNVYLTIKANCETKGKEKVTLHDD